MHHPTDRITHTTAFVTPVVEHWLEQEIAQWVHPMKDRSDNPSHHERTLYLWATSRSLKYGILFCGCPAPCSTSGAICSTNVHQINNVNKKTVSYIFYQSELQLYLVRNLFKYANQTVTHNLHQKMLYLTTHSTHFIYGYMASGIW